MWNVSVVDMVRGMTTRGPSHAFRYFISNGRILRNNFTIFYGWISSRMNRKYIQFFLVINEYVCCICPTESQWHLKSAQMKHFGNVMTTKTRSAFVYDTLYIENPRMFHSLQEIGIFVCVKSIQSLTISIPFRTTNPNWKKKPTQNGWFRTDQHIKFDERVREFREKIHERSHHCRFEGKTQVWIVRSHARAVCSGHMVYFIHQINCRNIHAHSCLMMILGKVGNNNRRQLGIHANPSVQRRSIIGPIG